MRQGESRDNSAAFEACDKHLTNKGNLLIAPEGSSWRERHIREIKSGTARIAFSAEIANNWQLGLKIFPVGITYDEKGDFGTSVVMSAEKAIHVADFKAIYEQKPDKAIDELTTKMLQFYDENTINCIDNEEDKMLKKIEYIFDTEKRPLTEGGYERGKKLLHQLRSIKNETLKWTNLQNDIDKYYNVLTEKGLNVPRRSFVNLMLWIIGLPILIYGFLTNGLTWLSCWALQRKLGLHDSYHPTLLYLSGLIFFPTILYLQIKILNYFYDLPFWINIIFAISVFIVGKAAIWLYTEGGILWQRRRYENHPDQKEIEILAEKVKAYFE
jgi:hypothetical protein